MSNFLFFLLFLVLSSKGIADAKETKKVSLREVLFQHKAQNKKLLRKIKPPAYSLSLDRLVKPIDYAWGYDQDDANFEQGLPIIEVDRSSEKWMVLVNFHGPAPLNISSVFDPSKRTLSWTVPLGYASYEFAHVGRIHDQLALLRAWTGGKYRKYASFIFIPPGNRTRFKIGVAAPQENIEKRWGGGVQMRMRSLPEGAIIVSLPLLEEDKSGHSKKIDLYARAKKAIQIADLNPSILKANFIGLEISPQVKTVKARQNWIKAFLHIFFKYRF